MKTEKSYKLEIHLDEIFDDQPISLEDLTGKVELALTNYLENIKLDITTAKDKDKVLYHRISIEGCLQNVDECHYRLQEANILRKEPLNFYRYIDEAGEQIRYLAYPILAEIEQKIRGFISRAIVDIWGFNWWNSHPPEKIAQKTEEIYARNNKHFLLHPLECTTFESLIAIVMAKLPNWQNDQTLTVNDLSKLLEECSSVEDIKNCLQEKTKKHSYWDNVFSQYFEDVEKWNKLEKDLKGLIIEQRNTVMHHRPMRFSMIHVLSKKRDEIIKLIDSAKPELPDEQRIEVKQEIQEMEMSRILNQMFTQTPSISSNINKTIEEQLRQRPKSIYETIEEQLRQRPKSIYETIEEQLRQRPKSIYETIEEQLRQFQLPTNYDLQNTSEESTIDSIGTVDDENDEIDSE